MRGDSVGVRWVHLVGAFVGSFAALLLVELQRPTNPCTGGSEDICMPVLILPLPLWLWALSALVGGLVGYGIAVGVVKASRHGI